MEKGDKHKHQGNMFLLHIKPFGCSPKRTTPDPHIRVDRNDKAKKLPLNASVMHTNIGDGRLNLACNNAYNAPSLEGSHHTRRPSVPSLTVPKHKLQKEEKVILSLLHAK